MSEHSAAALLRHLIAEKGHAAELRRRAAACAGRIVFAEAEDTRVIRAAIVLRELGLAKPVLLGSTGGVMTALRAEQVDVGAFEIIDPASDERARPIAEALYARRRAKGLSQGEAAVLAREPLQFAAGLVAASVCDASVAGAVYTTGEVIRAGLYHVGLAEGISVISGCFFMLPPDGAAVDRPLLFADAAVLPSPTEDQLVSIGVASAQTFQALTGRAGRVACLSFSTKGSADEESPRRMANVARRLSQLGVSADGELQLDAALMPAVAASKAPGSGIAGQADILLFPDLNSANIGYKLAQRLAGYTALGPILMGFRRPVYDLSRGCSAADIVNTTAIALLEAAGSGADATGGLPS